MNHSHQKGAPFRMRRSLFTSEPGRDHLSLHGCWIGYDDFFIALTGVFHGVSRAAGRRTVIKRQHAVRMIDQMPIPGMIAPAAVMHFQCDNIGRILQYAEIALSPCLRPVIRLSFMGNNGNQPDVRVLQPLDEKHLLRKENVPAAGSACQKSMVGFSSSNRLQMRCASTAGRGRYSSVSLVA